MNTLAKQKNKIKLIIIKIVKGIFISIYFLLLPQNVLADSVSTSKIATGTIKLLTDLTTWLLVLAPVLTTCVIIYFFIRKAATDEQEHKKWDNRIKVALVCCVLAVTISAVLKTLLSYYK